ncbi:MAG: Rrf2 family transcriptional regulator [Acidobacteria bacterium]|nr:MAG: Rrf2 family transcriptional regulator [Euryarchaeota archaeon]RPJ56831.1 MAG: Rrf2 family transcriptional regulator [Acidobacteriota bacterium]
MKITARVEYAVLALFELALGSSDRQVQAREISARQQIPLRFLEQILIQLKKAGLVKSVRGASGGYLLGKDAAHITLKDVVEAVEGELTLLDPHLSPDSMVSLVWREVEKDFLGKLSSITMQDLVRRKIRQDGILSYQI